jgi:hypothetical protein
MEPDEQSREYRDRVDSPTKERSRMGCSWRRLNKRTAPEQQVTRVRVGAAQSIHV